MAPFARFAAHLQNQQEQANQVRFHGGVHARKHGHGYICRSGSGLALVVHHSRVFGPLPIVRWCISLPPSFDREHADATLPCLLEHRPARRRSNAVPLIVVFVPACAVVLANTSNQCWV